MSSGMALTSCERGQRSRRRPAEVDPPRRGGPACTGGRAALTVLLDAYQHVLPFAIARLDENGSCDPPIGRVSVVHGGERPQEQVACRPLVDGTEPSADVVEIEMIHLSGWNVSEFRRSCTEENRPA